MRGGKVFCYVYREGKKTARDLVRLHQLTPGDLRAAKRGVKAAFIAKVLAWVVIQSLEQQHIRR